MSPGTVARQHAPHIVVPEDPTFPASTRHAYGLGWLIGRYRDHRLLDELLGLEPLDWFSSLKDRFDTLLTGMREARGARRVVPDAPRPRPLDAYAGEYEHPGYGTLTIAVEDCTLRPLLGTLDLSLAHRHYETFDLEWHELGDQSHLLPLMFWSDPEATSPRSPCPSSLRSNRCGSTGYPMPRRGTRRFLRRLCGTYAMGSIEVVVALRGDDVLTVTTPGALPFVLQPAGRGLRFAVTEQSATTAEFELDETGAVARLVVQPLGIFLPKT